MALAAKYKELMMLEIANWFKLSAAITLKSGVPIVQTRTEFWTAVQYVI